MVCRKDLGRQRESHSQENVQTRGNLACKRNVNMANISRGALPSFFGCKCNGEETYFQTCKGLCYFNCTINQLCFLSGLHCQIAITLANLNVHFSPITFIAHKRVPFFYSSLSKSTLLNLILTIMLERKSTDKNVGSEQMADGLRIHTVR